MPEGETNIAREETQEIPMSDDLRTLLDRYATDPRFNGKETARKACIDAILELNQFIQTAEIPDTIQAILLTGSLSEKKNWIPNIYTGGPNIGNLSSDRDVLIVLKGSPVRLHPRFHNGGDEAHYLVREWQGQGHIPDVGRLHITTTNRLPGFFHRYPTTERMLDVGTLLYGSMPPGSYGKHRNVGSPISIPQLEI